MPRFHINIHDGDIILDEEGRDYADLAEAKAEAICGARSLMAEHLIYGRPLNLRQRIEITDDDDMPVASILFNDVVTILS